MATTRHGRSLRGAPSGFDRRGLATPFTIGVVGEGARASTSGCSSSSRRAGHTSEETRSAMSLGRARRRRRAWARQRRDEEGEAVVDVSLLELDAELGAVVNLATTPASLTRRIADRAWLRSAADSGGSPSAASGANAPLTLQARRYRGHARRPCGRRLRSAGRARRDPYRPRARGPRGSFGKCLSARLLKARSRVPWGATQRRTLAPIGALGH